MAKYPLELLQLITFLKKLPGVGGRTAERFAFHLLSWSQNEAEQFSELVGSLKEKIKSCTECGCLTDQNLCVFCQNPHRDQTQLCIIASAKDAYSLEETGSYRGLYHVLGGLLSPMDGKTVEHLSLHRLKERVESLQTKEIIIALDSTLEGDTTSVFLKSQYLVLGAQRFKTRFWAASRQLFRFHRWGNPRKSARRKTANVVCPS